MLNCPALAADRPASAAELQKLEEQVRDLDKDLSVLKVTTDKQLDAQDKRIQDVGLATTQQSNYLAAIANETANVGNYIGWTSIAITIIVFIASLITYLSAKRRAQDEAKEASAQWFKENSRQLQEEIEDLKKRAEEAHSTMAAEQKKVTDHAQIIMESVTSAGETIINLTSKTDTLGNTEATREANNIVQVVSERLTTKPEVEFTHEEHYARGLARFGDGDYTTALASFESALSGLPPDAAAVDTARYVLAKGVTFGKLGRPNEEITAYDDIDTRFGTDPTPAVREKVVQGLFNKGVTLGTLGQSKEAIDVYDDLDRRFGADPTPAVREQLALARNSLGFSQLMLAKTHWTEEKQRRELLSAA